MAHEIEALDRPMYGSARPAWHGLGTVVEGQPTSADALRLAALDWPVDREPIYYDSGSNGPMRIPDSWAIARQDLDRADVRRILGVVGDRYRPIQNTTAFGIADAVVGESGARFETAGSLNNGRRVWLLAKLPDRMTIVDDVIDKYLLISTSHDATQALEIRTTPVRVVCANTLAMAVRGAKQRVSIRHTESHDRQIRQAVAILQDAEAYFSATGELLHKLASTRIDDRFVSAYLQALVPDPKEASKTRAENARRDIRWLYNGGQHGADQEAIRGTAYGLFNALSEYVDHHRTVRRSKGRSAAEARFDATMFGSGASFRQDAIELLDHAIEHIDDSPVELLMNQIAVN